MKESERSTCNANNNKNRLNRPGGKWSLMRSSLGIERIRHVLPSPSNLVTLPLSFSLLSCVSCIIYCSSVSCMSRATFSPLTEERGCDARRSDCHKKKRNDKRREEQRAASVCAFTRGSAWKVLLQIQLWPFVCECVCVRACVQALLAARFCAKLSQERKRFRKGHTK